MARYPGALWRPITASKGRKPLALHNRVNLHVAVSESPSLHSFFNVPGRADSHFYVRKDGTVEQYVDTSLRAFADLEGNDATISVETQGGLKDPNGEPWTPEQVEALARLYAWAVTTHGVPRQIARDSKIGPSSHGLSWHRLGIDGNFPALPDVRAGRAQRGGGMHYSTSGGKLCPGDAKIRQVPDVYARAVELLTPRKRLAIIPTFNKATRREWQRQLGRLTANGKFDARSAARLRSRLNGKAGKGGFALKSPLAGNGEMTGRDWKAVQKLINAWAKRGEISLKRPLRITGKRDARTVMALRKSLNANLWE